MGDIFNASKDSIALPNRTNRPVLSKVDHLMALCDELEVGAGAGADRWRGVDGGCCASCAGGVMWEFLWTLEKVRSISAPIP